MLSSVDSKLDDLQIMATEFIATNSGEYYSKDKIVELNKSEKLTIKFNYINVAISKNGGLIALCKQPKYRDLSGTKINDNIIVMHQNASTRYCIPINWNYSERFVVNLEFNDKEQLFAFCCDGVIYKIDILRQKAVQIYNKYQQEGIHIAKLFEKGYILLTEIGNIYLREDIKDSIPEFIISVTQQLGFSTDINFIGIPAKKSCSGKFEILINNQKGEGVIHVEKPEAKDNERAQSFQVERKNMNKGRVVKASLLNSEYLEEYKEKTRIRTQTMPKNDGFVVVGNDLNSKLKGDYSDQLYDDNSEANNKIEIGKVTKMAMSPSQDYIALYVSESNTVFYLSSQISNKVQNKMEKLKFEVDSSADTKEKTIQKNILSFKSDQQFLFCGNHTVAICGGKYIMMVNLKNENIAILVDPVDYKENPGHIYCRCISEVDGIRYITEKEVFLIWPVPRELGQICNPFSKANSLKLVKSYGNYISKNPVCNDLLKQIGENLPEAILEVATAAANIYWTEEDTDTFQKRDIQNFIIKAAQFGKSIAEKEVFNYHKFNFICKSIRIINSMRNFPLKPRYLTYKEYLSMNPEFPAELINKTMRQLNFKLAYEICKFLGDDEKNIYLRYAISKIKKLGEGTRSEENLVYDELMETFKRCDDISFIEIAKKCIKYHKYDLAERFLQNEKSVLVKIPQYLQLGKWNKALELSLKSCDLNVIRVVIDKIYKVEEPDSFNSIMASFPQAHSAVINYYKNIGKIEELNKYLNTLKDQEELLFISLENFFKSTSLEERKKHLGEAKKCLNSAKNIDYKFYKIYLSDLENSLKFKEKCFEQDKENKPIINPNDTTPFDNSIYDCFQKAGPERLSWIESQNKKFEISKRKMTILRFRTLANNKKFDEIDTIVQKEGYKKLDISPLKVAKIFYEYKDNKRALEYAMLENNQDLNKDKFNFIMEMGEPLAAARAIISDKKNEQKINYINEILRVKPDLKPKIDELCQEYKVRL